MLRAARYEHRHPAAQAVRPGRSPYGVIFDDDLAPFDFWGCSDLDIIWGDIRRFATDARLRGLDIFSSRKEKLSGHCTFYRNATGRESIIRAHSRRPRAARDVALRAPRRTRADDSTCARTPASTGKRNWRRMPLIRKHWVTQNLWWKKRPDLRARRPGADVHPLPQTETGHEDD
jgi:hypothetical protein